MEAAEVPAMRNGHIVQFFERFRERYIQTFLAAASALKQKLKRQSRLPASGIAFDDV